MMNFPIFTKKLFALLLIICYFPNYQAVADGKVPKVIEIPAFQFKGTSQAPIVIEAPQTAFSVGELVPIVITGGTGNGSIKYLAKGRFCTIQGASVTASAPSTCTVYASKAGNLTSNLIASSGTNFNFGSAQQPLLVQADTATVKTMRGVSVRLSTSGGSGSGAIKFNVSEGDVCPKADSSTVGSIACSAFSNRTGSVCSVVGDSLTVTAPATCIISATKLADSTYYEQSSEPIKLTFRQSDNNSIIYIPTPPTPTNTRTVVVYVPKNVYVPTPPKVIYVPQPANGPELVISNEPSDTLHTVGEKVIVTTKSSQGAGQVKFRLLPNSFISMTDTETVTSTSGNCVLNPNSGELTANLPGLCSVQAQQSVPSNTKLATSQVVVFTFQGLQDQLILNSPEDNIKVNTPIVLETTGGSGSGAVSFNILNGTGGSIIGNKFSSSASGTFTIVAYKKGDSLYKATSSEPITINVTN